MGSGTRENRRSLKRSEEAGRGGKKKRIAGEPFLKKGSPGAPPKNFRMIFS